MIEGWDRSGARNDCFCIPNLEVAWDTSGFLDS